jgi:transcriptional regulator with XRE-family HTH domain
MNWHKRLTAAREAKGIKKSAFAKLVGVSAPTVTDWENGDTKMIEGANLIKVCDILGIAPEQLIYGKDSNTPKSTVQVPLFMAAPEDTRPARMQWVSDAESVILSDYRTTDDAGKSKIERTAKLTKKVLFLGLVDDKSKM